MGMYEAVREGGCLEKRCKANAKEEQGKWKWFQRSTWYSGESEKKSVHNS